MLECTPRVGDVALSSSDAVQLAGTAFGSIAVTLEV